MTRHEQHSALRPEILAARIYVALLAAAPDGWYDSEYDSRRASRACDAAASFIAEWRTRDHETGKPNGLPVDADDDFAVERGY